MPVAGHAARTARQRACCLQTFKKIHVAGEPPPVVKPKKNPVKQPLDAHMAAARLRLFVFDRTTGATPLWERGRRQPKDGVLLSCTAGSRAPR